VTSQSQEVFRRVWKQLYAGDCRSQVSFRHRRSQGGKRGHGHRKFLENTVISCFEMRFSKQNGVIRPKSNILAPPKFLGWLRHWLSTPLTPKSFFVSMQPRTVWVGAPKLSLSPGAGNPRYATARCAPAHHDCLAKMAKYVTKILAHQWQIINHKPFQTKCCWLSKSFYYRK